MKEVHTCIVQLPTFLFICSQQTAVAIPSLPDMTIELVGHFPCLFTYTYIATATYHLSLVCKFNLFIPSAFPILSCFLPSLLLLPSFPPSPLLPSPPSPPSLPPLSFLPLSSSPLLPPFPPLSSTLPPSLSSSLLLLPSFPSLSFPPLSSSPLLPPSPPPLYSLPSLLFPLLPPFPPPLSSPLPSPLLLSSLSSFLPQAPPAPDNIDAPTKNYILYSDTEEEMLEWINAITGEIKPAMGSGRAMANGHPSMTTRGGKKKEEVDQKAFDEVCVHVCMRMYMCVCGGVSMCGGVGGWRVPSDHAYLINVLSGLGICLVKSA